MKSKQLLAIGSVAACLFTLVRCSEPSEKNTSTAETEKAVVKEDVLDKGKYLLAIGGCNDCHTPKVMTPQGPMLDTTKIMSGHPAGSPLPEITYDATKPGNWVLISGTLTAAVGPWGMSYAANLTPDSTTGIGSWTVENFIGAIRKGKHLGQDGGRPLLPPMPWQSIAQWKDEDLTALFNYLKTLPAISNAVPAPVPPTALMKK